MRLAPGHARTRQLVNRGQVFHLLLGDVEPDSGVDPDNRADRDADFLASPQMSFLEQYVGHMVVARIAQDALYLPDLTIQRVDTLTALHVCFTQRDHVVEYDRRTVFHAHADSHTGGLYAAHTAVALDRLSLSVAAAVIEPLHQVGLLGEIELAEFRGGTAQPDLAGRRVHKVDGNKSAWLWPVLRFDHKMGDGKSHRVHNQTAHLAANAIRGTGLGPDRELRRLCHGCRLLPCSRGLFTHNVDGLSRR